MQQLTDRQECFLRFIEGYIHHNSRAPTVREVGEYFSVSPRAAHEQIQVLIGKHYLECGQGARALRLAADYTQANRDALVRVPLLGRVAAGLPILAEENIDSHIDVPTSPHAYGVDKQGRAPDFALRVTGDSMINAGILPDDIALMRKQSTANNNDIVVAVLNEGITLKRFVRESGRICLRAENPAYDPIYSRNVQVVGKMVSLLRNYV